jgi:hypothetical protein
MGCQIFSHDNPMGLDRVFVAWLNKAMEVSLIDTLVEKAKKLFVGEKIDHMTPSDVECEDLRATMRGQFVKLKEKGLSIRIISL